LNQTASTISPTTRRELLKTIPAAPLALAAACSTSGPPDRHAAAVKVTGLDIIRVHVNRLGQWVIARIHTDAGLSGIGDASQAGHKNDPQIAKLEEYFELIKGHSIYDIEWLRQQVHPQWPEFRRATACALSGIEQALYDLQGQVAGVPTYQLFGGKLRDTVRNYANINRSTEERDPKGFAAMAKSAREAGLDAVKLASFDGIRDTKTPAEFEKYTQLGIDCVSAVREAMGDEADVMVDAHRNFDLELGLDLARRLEPLNLFWLEEVSRSLENLAAVNQAAKMPTAGGELLFGLEQSHKYIAAGAVDILMPDVKYCGGMLELKKIAAMAEGAGLSVAPHGPASPVGNMAAAHVCVGMPNALILEFSHGEVPWRAELVDPPEVLDKGHLAVSDRPGLGMRINDAVAEKYKAR
jgi:galactonate dehydratase